MGISGHMPVTLAMLEETDPVQHRGTVQPELTAGRAGPAPLPHVAGPKLPQGAKRDVATAGY